MPTSSSHRLLDIEWPDFGGGELPPSAGAAELVGRIERVRGRMEERGLSHLVVYADREHFANLAYLTGFDPRFEEALLVLGRDRSPLLLVGNECVGRLTVSPLHETGELRSELYQPLSLLSQSRDRSRLLGEILVAEGISLRGVVGCAGWKYFGEDEHPAAWKCMEIPSYIVDTLRSLAGADGVVNATGIFMHPADGLRTTCSPSEIAFFEHANVLSSESVKRVIHGLEDGMTDFDVAKRLEYNGLPLSCHVGMKTAGNRHIGLASPAGTVVRRGDPFSTNFGYWGSNICRVGWVAEDASDLPEAARDYVEAFAGPYVEAMGEWYRNLRIGTPGGDLAELIQRLLPFEDFAISLNPGHLIHLDEWLSSPIYDGSPHPLRSGMYLQADVIPRSPVYFGTRMEDGVVLADEGLRRELEEHYPGCYSRCQKRRDFMTDVLGYELPEEVLPLSNIPALVAPFLLRPERVLALS